MSKPHKLIVRISESQLRWLTEVLVMEQRTKSQILREALNQYIIEKNPKHEEPQSKKTPTKPKK